MKKVITILALVISLNASAQKDTTAKDTLFVFNLKEMAILQNILMESHIIQQNKQLTGKELGTLLQWLTDPKRARIVPKKESK